MATTYRPTTAKLSEYVTPVWEFRDFPVDTPLSTLLDPETWAHVSKKFKPGDELLVKPQGLPYRAHLIVMDAGAVFAKVRLIDLKPLNAEMAALVAEASPPVDETVSDAVPGSMAVRWNPGAKKYSVYRSSDNEKVHEGFVVKADAEEWAAKHALALAA